MMLVPTLTRIGASLTSSTADVISFATISLTAAGALIAPKIHPMMKIVNIIIKHLPQIEQHVEQEQEHAIMSMKHWNGKYSSPQVINLLHALRVTCQMFWMRFAHLEQQVIFQLHTPSAPMYNSE